MPDAEAVRNEAMNAPIDVELYEEDAADLNELSSASPSLPSRTIDDDDYISEDVDVFADASSSSPSSSPSGHPRSLVANSASNANIRTIAASAKTGTGLNDFAEAIIAAAATTLQGVDLIIPYAEDKGTIAAIQGAGVIQEMSYTETATILSAQVPSSMMPRLKSFLRKN